MNTISLNDKQARLFLMLALVILAGAACWHFIREAKKNHLSNADAYREAERRLHQHLAFARQELTAGMTALAQSINSRLDELEYNTRPQLAAATEVIKQERVGFRPSYMQRAEKDA